MLFKLILFIIILIIAGLIALPFIVDPNDYKQEITEQVEKATGRTLIINGDIDLSVFPWIALELGQLSLSNAQGFKAETFANVDAADIRIKLMPLLSKKLELDTIILDGLVLNLEKNKAGKTNWDDLTGGSKKVDDKKPAESNASNQESSASLAAVTIAGVKLTNANILWDDASTAENYQLKNFNLTTDPLIPSKPTALNISFNVASQKPQAEAHIELAGKIMLDMDNQQYSFTGLNFSTQAKGSEIGFEKADINLTGDITADMVKQLITVDGLQLSAEITEPSLPGGKANLELSSNIIANMKQQTADLSKLVISLQDLSITGDVKASKLSSDNPNVDGTINIAAFNLRQLAKSMAIELPIMADDSTLELVQLNTNFSASSKHFNAKNIAVILDQSELTGQFSLTNFSSPAYNFKLNLDEIDADRYLPPASEESASTTPTSSSPAPASEASSGADKLPLEPLRAINAKGIIDIAKLKISGTHSEKIHLELNASKGLIKLSPISANLYQGQYKGNVNLDARGKTLKLAIDENLTDVQAGPLLKDLTGDDQLSGAANAQVKLTGNGATVDGIKKTLSGKGQFSFKDGAVKGINIAESIRKAKAVLKGGTTTTSEAPLQTDFASLTGSFVATNGIISNQDLALMSPLLRLNGAGKVDLPKEGINYGLKVSIVGSSKGQAGKELADLKGLTIPVKITGTFSKPKPSVDLASMFKEQATEEIKAKVADKLQDKLGGDLGGLLGGVLGTTAAPTEEKATEDVPEKSTEDEAKDALKNTLKSFF
jgi:AsmA protein